MNVENLLFTFELISFTKQKKVCHYFFYNILVSALHKWNLNLPYFRVKYFFYKCTYCVIFMAGCLCLNEVGGLLMK